MHGSLRRRALDSPLRVGHDRAAFERQRSLQGGSPERREVDQQEGAAEAVWGAAPAPAYRFPEDATQLDLIHYVPRLKARVELDLDRKLDRIT